MLIIRGAVKDYDWGIVDGLAPWAGVTSGKPQAELWFGVHPGGPSPLIDASGELTGEHLADHFDVTAIPVLVKLLAAARPLSVQVHPTHERAGVLWTAQQSGKGPVVLSDPFEKTEMLVALEPFEALAGWRATDQAADIYEGVPGAAAVATALREREIARAISEVLAIDPARGAIAHMPDAVAAVIDDPGERHGYATVAALYPEDRGALLTPMLAYVRLARGEALYLPAGVPHSYIRGVGLEVMSSSDNVLRLGLTTKPVFVNEALESLEWDRRPLVARAQVGARIAPAGAPFAATLMTGGSSILPTGAFRIVLLIEGEASISTSLADIQLHPGTAAVLSATDPETSVSVNGMAALVTSEGS